MICPTCREPMIVLEYNRIELDVCSSCQGIWFDHDELELLLGSLNLGEAVGRPLDRETAEAPRKCPYCGKKMEKILAGPNADVMIDRCRNGHGLWFDGGELDAIIRSLEQAEPGRSHKIGSFLKDVLCTKGDGEPDPQQNP